MKRILAMVFVLCLITTSALAWGASKSDQYNDACNLLSDGSYAEAAAKFAELGEYQDASLLNVYCSALEAAKNGQFSLALGGFQALGDFRDSKMQALYYAAIAYEFQEKYEDAEELLLQVPFFKDSNTRILTYPEKIKARDYARADQAEKNNQLETALKGFTSLGNYSDSKARAEAVREKINARDYAAAEKEEGKGNLEKALEGFIALGSYSDSADRAEAVREKIRERDYNAADQAEKDGDYAAALSGFTALGNYKDSHDRALAVKDKGTYAQALQNAMEGKFAQAYELFASLGEYEDSAEKTYTLGVCKFAEITDKGNGIAAFKFHEKYGIINVQTNTTVSPNWDMVGGFNQDGLAKVQSGEKFGYIDVNGNIIIECKWDDISGFADGLCTIAKKSGKNYLFGIYDTAGNEISEAQWRTLGKSYNSNWDSSYNLSNTHMPEVNEGKIKVQNQEGLWGFINTKGEAVGEIRWESIEGFSEDAAVITEKGKYGFLNKDGTVLIEPQYAEAYSFSDGLAAVKANGRWGYIDHSNSFVVQPYYGQVSSFTNGYADVYLNGTGWQIIDRTGTLQYFINAKMISDYEAAAAYFNNGEYREAYTLFSRLVGYRDSNEMAAKASKEMKAAGGDLAGDVVNEIYTPPVKAGLYFLDPNYNSHGSVPEVIIQTSGKYTIRKELESPSSDIYSLRIDIENEDRTDQTNLTGRCVKIEEILINGNPVPFGKNFTYEGSFIATWDNDREYFYIYTPIYFTNEMESTGVAWDGETINGGQPIIDVTGITDIETIEITFTYGIFQ